MLLSRVQRKQVSRQVNVSLELRMNLTRVTYSRRTLQAPGWTRRGPPIFFLEILFKIFFSKGNSFGFFFARVNSKNKSFIRKIARILL